MKHLISTEVTQKRIANWLSQAEERNVTLNNTWTERRQAIEFGGHTYLVSNGQVFQCLCGRYDPEWSSTEILVFFEENFGIKPHEIEVTCSYKSDK